MVINEDSIWPTIKGNLNIPQNLLSFVKAKYLTVTLVSSAGNKSIYINSFVTT